MLHPWNHSLWRSLDLPQREQPAALLLSGPRGVGKRAFALHLAQALLCHTPNADGEGCDDCPSCRLLAAGNHPDYRLLEPGEDSTGEDEGKNERDSPASRWIKVQQVRALGDLVVLRPHLGRRRVVVIAAADRLHPSAANALLKTLEEPPQDTHFVLVTSTVKRLPPTILSRCVQIKFALPAIKTAIDWLASSGAEQPSLALAQAAQAPLVARELDTVEYWARRKRLIQQVLASRDFDPLVASERMTPEEVAFLVGNLQRWCHDLVLLRLCGQLRYNPDCAQILHPLAERLALTPFMAFLRDLQSTARHLEHPLNPRLVAERCLIGYKRAMNMAE